MRAIYIVDDTSCIGGQFGVKTYIENLIYALDKNSYQITVVTLFAEEKEVVVETVNECRYISIPKPTGKEVDRESYFRSSYFVLYPYIEQEINPVFHFNYQDCIELVKLLKANLNVFVVLTIHYRQLHTSYNQKAETALYNSYCDKILLSTKHSYQSIIKDFDVNPEKLEIISLGLVDGYKNLSDEEKRDIKEKYKFDPKDKILLFAGRLDTNKNIAFVVWLFLEIIRKIPNLRLVVVGSGNYQQLLGAITHSHARVTIMGYQSKKDLYDIYQITDIGIIPSFYEEFGLVALEMMMHEIPILANYTSGLAELVKDGLNGEVITSFSTGYDENFKEAVSKLENLLCNKIRSKEMGINGRRIFLEKYEINCFQNKMKKIYK